MTHEQGSSNPTPPTYPRRHPGVTAVALPETTPPRYLLLQPESRAHLSLSEADYALWWQMDGQRTLHDLLHYHLKRYGTLPAAHFKELIMALNNGRFLLTPAPPATPPSPAISWPQALRQTNYPLAGLDDLFTPLHARLQPFLTLPGGFIALLLIVGGGFLLAQLAWNSSISLLPAGGWSLPTLFLTFMAGQISRQLAQGVALKHAGGTVSQGWLHLHWGIPSLTIDQRDRQWLPRHARLQVAAAAPLAGLLVAGLAGAALTAVAHYAPQLALSHNFASRFVLGFVYQLGLVAALGTFYHLNPRQQSDGYQLLRELWQMPGLSYQARRFWQQPLGQQLAPSPFTTHHRYLVVSAGLVILWYALALLLLSGLWQTRWRLALQATWEQPGGRWLIAGLTAVIAAVLAHEIWQRSRPRWLTAGRWWLKHPLLIHPETVALLLGIPLLFLLPITLLILATLTANDLPRSLLVWSVHLTAVWGIWQMGQRQLPGTPYRSLLRWLLLGPLGLCLAWLAGELVWLREAGLLVAASGILLAGHRGWAAAAPKYLAWGDKLLLGTLILLGSGQIWLVACTNCWLNGRFPLTLTSILLAVYLGLIGLAPLLLNFWPTPLAYPWCLLVLPMPALPWAVDYPNLQLAITVLWLYAGLLYLALHQLAQVSWATPAAQAAGQSEQRHLRLAFDRLLQGFWGRCRLLLGQRPLDPIQAQLLALRLHEPQPDVAALGRRLGVGLLLAVDRLNQLLPRTTTRAMVTTALAGLPWVDRRQLTREVLAQTEWGQPLVTTFVREQATRLALLGQTAVLQQLSSHALNQVLDLAQVITQPADTVLAVAGEPARQFMVVLRGTVVQGPEEGGTAVFQSGGAIGCSAWQHEGVYTATAYTQTPVQLLRLEQPQLTYLLAHSPEIAGRVGQIARLLPLLQANARLAGWPVAALRELAALFEQRTVDPETAVLPPGAPGQHWYLIESGEVESQPGVGEPGGLTAGMDWGIEWLLRPGETAVGYRAVTAVQLWLLSYDTFNCWLSDGRLPLKAPDLWPTLAG